MTDQPIIVERFAEIAGFRTRVLEVPGDGPAILLLHGFTDSADSWRPLLAELAARSRRAVAVDMPGSGHAPTLGRPVLSSLDRFADGFVHAYAGGDGAVLAGNSLGGMVALRAAARPGLPLLAVAGLGPAGLAYHYRLESLARWLTRLDPVLRILDRVPVPTSIVRGALRVLYDRRLARGRGDASLGRRYASHIDGVRDLGRIRGDLIALHRDETRLSPDTLRNIGMPVLLVWGDTDHLADVSGAPILLRTVAESELVVLDDCGHCPQVEAPELVARLLVTLPSSAVPRGAGGAEKADGATAPRSNTTWENP
jgi:pimeloyl-ACP methyl ester carboxylesterase